MSTRGERGTESIATRSQESAGEGARAEPALRVIHSPDAALLGRYLPLGRGDRVFGRSHAADVPIDDPSMSRRHARVVWLDGRGGHAIVDLGSRNGTRVDGRAVEGENAREGERPLLTPGSLVRLGDTLLQHGPVDLRLAGWRPPPGAEMVGCSAALRDVLDAATRVAKTDMSVMILGETGVGKDLLARWIHAASGLAGPFVAVNCAGLAPTLASSELFGHVRGAFSGAHAAHDGLFVSAQGGTLFLDEVGELDLATQAQLLRAVEEGRVRPVGAARSVPVNVRLVSATNAPVERGLPQGRFRADLFARLAQWVVRVPPLRERREDVPALAVAMLARFGEGATYRLSGEAAERLALRDWPRNARELIACVRAAIVMNPGGGTLTGKHFPDLLGAVAEPPPGSSRPVPARDDGAAALALPTRDEAPTRAELEALLRRHDGCVADVARQLGRERMQIYRWLRRHAIDPERFRS
jgi:DNA-binding NtrC family response regulator